MEAVERRRGVNLSDTTEEETPPWESNSFCNHGDGGIASCTAEATTEVTMETGQSEDPPVAPRATGSGPVVVQGQNLASEQLQRVRRWSITTYKCTRQVLSEKLGRGSRTVDLDLEPQLELLKDDRRRYDRATKLAQTLAAQLAQLAATQGTLGAAFAELGLKTPALHVEFGVNAKAQKFLCKSGEMLAAAINSFTAAMNTLVHRTMEDTMVSVRQYEAARIEYDAYRVDLEELNLGPRDAVTLPRLEQAQRDLQSQRGRYQKVREDLSVKVKLLQENKVKVLHNQLWLLHGAVATNSSSCHVFLQQNVSQAGERLGSPDLGVGAPSWLEES